MDAREKEASQEGNENQEKEIGRKKMLHGSSALSVCLLEGRTEPSYGNEEKVGRWLLLN